MSEREARIRSTLMSYFPMLIAVLSLCASIYSGYLYSKFIDIIQRNVGRVEDMKTCKEIIEAYFLVKAKTALIMANGERERAGNAASNGMSTDQMEGATAVAKFAALGTYLANLRGDAVRERYTQLSHQVEKIISEASRTPRSDLNKVFESADRLFSEMNDDCIRTAKAPMI